MAKRSLPALFHQYSGWDHETKQAVESIELFGAVAGPRQTPASAAHVRDNAPALFYSVLPCSAGFAGIVM